MLEFTGFGLKPKQILSKIQSFETPRICRFEAYIKLYNFYYVK